MHRFAAAKRSQAFGQLRKLGPIRVPEADRYTDHRQLLFASWIKVLTRVRQNHSHNRVRHNIDVSLIDAHIAKQFSRLRISDRNIFTATKCRGDQRIEQLSIYRPNSLCINKRRFTQPLSQLDNSNIIRN
ncbi:hypothetical protein D3C73_1413140 [compost metagenome]